MTTDEIIGDRQIAEVLHFTTNRGLVGILDRRTILSRKRVHNTKRLEYILTPNTPIVKDPQWIDYVNLSITRINTQLFQISSDRWHQDVWWAILAIDPAILTHDGVYFVTANNIWPRARRAQGTLGLEALFAQRVVGRYDRVHERTEGMPANLTTCDQAEVLYPNALATESLHRIYVRTGEEQDDVHAQMAALGHRECDVAIEPGMFGSGA